MKTTYTVELYHERSEVVNRIEMTASPSEISRIAQELLRGSDYDGMRILRTVMKPQVVEVLHYHKRGGMIRAVYE